ncbi:UNKNOWN [Stylonychia lemnae]|uniref:Transmembrane protein n=1 Tax=Stylonychia lemnae TaxID=5949 RepID=A0A078A1W1_STYLE|nr:UNKNOWN [Stylonychia lemnae]|eukprot:CDW74779.1 UNKNOWN [Stylonychia lemnae]
MKRQSKKEKYLRVLNNFLRFISIGKHNSGLYYKEKVFFSTFVGGIITLVAAIIVLALSISTLIEIFSLEKITYTVQNDTLNLPNFDSLTNVGKMIKEMQISILATHIQRNLKCSDVAFSADFHQYQKPVISLNFDCGLVLDSKYSGRYFLELQVNTKEQQYISEQKLDSFQTIILSLNLTNPDLKVDDMNIFFQSQYFYFDNKQIQKTDKSSMALFQGSYQIKVNQLLYHYTNDVFQLSKHYISELYFFNDYPVQMVNQQRDKSDYSFYIQIDDLFVWQVVRVTPESIFYGIAKIGGYISFLSFIRIIISIVHQKQFEKSLILSFTKRDKQSDKKSDDYRRRIIVKEIFSYEKLKDIIEYYETKIDLLKRKNQILQENKSSSLNDYEFDTKSPQLSSFEDASQIHLIDP